MDYLAHLVLQVEMEEMEQAFSPQLSLVHKAHVQMVELDLLIQMEVQHMPATVQVALPEVLVLQVLQAPQVLAVAAVVVELEPELLFKVLAKPIMKCISV
jgi:hypothetical protein